MEKLVNCLNYTYQNRQDRVCRSVSRLKTMVISDDPKKRWPGTSSHMEARLRFWMKWNDTQGAAWRRLQNSTLQSKINFAGGLSRQKLLYESAHRLPTRDPFIKSIHIMPLISDYWCGHPINIHELNWRMNRSLLLLYERENHHYRSFRFSCEAIRDGTIEGVWCFYGRMIR